MCLVQCLKGRRDRGDHQAMGRGEEGKRDNGGEGGRGNGRDVRMRGRGGMGRQERVIMGRRRLLHKPLHYNCLRLMMYY